MENKRALRLLWKHPHPESTRTYEFQKFVEAKYGVSLSDYEALRQWSISNIGSFWEEAWHFTGVRASQPFRKVNARRGYVYLVES